MSHPTYRERTNQFRKLRNSFINTPYIPSTEISIGSDKSLLPNNGPNSSDINLIVSITPSWIQIVESIDDNLNKIEQQIGLLKEYHSLRQRIIFDDDKADEYDINIQETTYSITSLFKSSKVKLQEIALKGNEELRAGFEERTIRYNAMRSRATKLQQLTKIFRNAQRQFLEEMKNKKDKIHKYIDIDNVTKTLPDLSTDYDSNFNEEQIQILHEMENEASDKTQQILNIAKSVHELAELFNDLSILVVESGSLLDRIDYNVEQTLETLENTVPIIDRTNKYQKRSKSALCIIILIMLIILFGAILVLRHI